MTTLEADPAVDAPAPAASDKDRRRRPTESVIAAHHRWQSLGTYLLVIVLTALAAVGLNWSQNRTEEAVHQRFVARTAQSAGFVETFTSQLLRRERVVASKVLVQPDVSQLGPVVDAFGNQAAVLLDDQGSLLAIVPPAPNLLGTRVGLRYAHLRAALGGTPAVSDVVPSAAHGDPVIGFATPFDSPEGRRVFSGAFLVADTPLREYLNGMSTLPGFRGFIVDSVGNIVAASGAPRRRISTLTASMPAVATSISRQSYGVDDTGRYDVVTKIEGTPWRLVLSVPDDALLITAQAHNTEQGAGLGVLALIGLLTCWLGIRVRDGRHALQVANGALEELAHRDGLTGLWNRRRLDELLVTEHERCRREQQPLSVLLVDIDHFKRVNDTFGHTAGDGVLRAVADRIRGSLRDADNVGRWGGEEFLVLLPFTHAVEAVKVAERIRLAVGAAALSLSTGGDELGVTVSIGCYGDASSPTETLVNQADNAMYAAKSAGRNRVIAPQHASQGSAQGLVDTYL